jgi:hypothetical protein
MGGSDCERLAIMGEGIWFEGFHPRELDEVEEWFAGAIEPAKGLAPSFTIRMNRARVELPSAIGRYVRHRANIRPKTLFLDGSEFDQRVQSRDVELISESPAGCTMLADGVVLVGTPVSLDIWGPAPPPLLLADVVENWLLWRSRESGLVMVHASGWRNDGSAELCVGTAGDGKTTTLFEQVGRGARYFANDRVALRLSGDVLLGRTFPEPINIGVGTIKALGLEFPTFGLAENCAIRLLALEVFRRWQPDFYSWFPVSKITTRDRDTLNRNVYWDEDPDHPFWNRALRPRPLRDRERIETAIEARLAFAERSR